MNSDERLRKLLRKEPDLEPSPAFSAGVWRRIRQTEEKPREMPGFGHLLQWLWLNPARISVAAALLGMFLGIAVARVQSGSHEAAGQTTLAFNRPGTMTGIYVQLLTGGR